MNRFCQICGCRVIEIIPTKRRRHWRHEGYVSQESRRRFGSHPAKPRPLPVGEWLWDEVKGEAVFHPAS